jgi:drug/metabolite transporter (DMT)-like permease
VTHTRALSGQAQPLYVVALFLATVGWSFGTLLQKRSATPDTVLSFTCGQMLFGALFQLAMAFFTREWSNFDPTQISVQSMLAIFYLVVFGSIVGLNCYLWLLTRVPAPKVTTYALVNPVVALLLGAVVLKEPVTALVMIAAALVLLGVSLVLFQNFNPLQLLRARYGRCQRVMPADESR